MIYLKRLRWLPIGILVLATVGMGIAYGANDGMPDDQPVTVGTTKGKKRDGTPNNPTTTSGNTSASGGFALDLKNGTDLDATDVHIRVDSPSGAKIKSATWLGNPADFTTENQLPAQTLEAHGFLGGGDQTSVDVTIEDKDGNVLDTERVKLSIWWSRGENHDIWLCATSPDTIGSGDPMATLTSLNIPNYTESVVQVPESVDEADLNVIVLAECHGFRFQDGSLVVSTNEGQRFEMGASTGEELVVTAWDEDGDQVTAQQRVSFSNPRIDVNGNFVIDVDRAQDDDKHIVIVINNLRVTGMTTRAVGDPIAVSFSGAPIGGGCLDEIYELAEVVWN